LERQIERHREKIAKEYSKPSPDLCAIRKWEKDIDIFHQEVERLRAQLPGKRKKGA
jgi:hypothetical protein